MKKLPVRKNWFLSLDIGNGITLIREQYLDPAAAGNIWYIRGRERDILFDAGTGLVSLKSSFPDLAGRPVIHAVSHSHYDHAGGSREFSDRRIHHLEADILSHPDPENTSAAGFFDGTRYHAVPFPGFKPEEFLLRPAPPSGLLEEGDILDLGDRLFRVLHLPGHSPGSIALYEEETGLLFSGDVVYDGRMYDTVYHSDPAAYRKSLQRLLDLDIDTVHGGHFESMAKQKMVHRIKTFLNSKQGEIDD